MSFKETYPDYAAIEAHIRRARIERSVALAHLIAEALDGTWRGLKKMGAAVANIKPLKPVRPLASR